MANISGNIDKNNPKRAKLTEILKQIVSNKAVLELFLSNFHGIEFKNDGRALKTNSLEIVLSSNNEYYLNNHNPDKYAVPSGNISVQLLRYTEHLTGKERADAQYQVLSALGVDIYTGTVETLTPTSQTTHQPDPKDQTGSQLNKRTLPIFTTFSSYCGKSVSKYFLRKTGATIDTLKRYAVRPILERTTAKGLVFRHGETNPCFAYCTDDSIKIKQPLQSGGKMFDWIRIDAALYCFGFGQLPATGETLVLCAGEDDAVCINHHFNKSGVWAVCFGGENRLPDPEILNGLKLRFERILCLYDMDSTGIAKSKEIATKNGLIWTDVKDAFNFFKIPPESRFTGKPIKDICDLYQFYYQNSDLDGFFRLIKYVLYSNSMVYADPKDCFSVSINHCYTVDFNEYLGETYDNKHGFSPVRYLEHRLYYGNKLILQSAAGTGKSTWIYSLIHSTTTPMEFVKDWLGCERLIIAEPTTAIALQLYNSFLEKGLDKRLISLVMGVEGQRATKGDLLSSQITIVVYDSLAKVGENIPDALLIVDEYHQLANDKGYRDSAMTLLYRAMDSAKKTLLLSATPNYLLCTDLHPSFGYQLIIGNPLTVNKIHLKSYVHKCSKRHLYDWIEENAPKTGTICIKRDNVKELEAWQSLCDSRGIACNIAASKERKYKEENPVYNSIMKTGKPQNALRYLLFTTVLEAGVSFTFPVGAMCLLDVVSWSRISQLINRPRQNFKSGVNTDIQVFLFIPEKQVSPETSGKGIIERFNEAYQLASHFASELNAMDNKEAKNKRAYKVASDIKKAVVIDHKTGLWIPDLPEILHRLYRQETAETSLSQLISRLCRFDSRIIAYQPETITPLADESIDAVLEAVKIEREKGVQAFRGLIRADYRKVVQAVLYRSKDLDFKTKVKGAFQLPELDKEEMRNFITTHKEAFTTREPKRIVNQIYELLLTGVNIIDAQKIVLEFDKSETNTYIERSKIKNRCSDKRKGNPLGESDRWELEKYKAIIGKFDQLLKNIAKGNRSNQFTGKQLWNMVNAALSGIMKGHKVGQKEAIDQIKALYDLEMKRFSENGKRTWHYTFSTLGRGKIDRPK